jgi:hypothetical protein
VPAVQEAAIWARRVHEWAATLRVIDPSPLRLLTPERAVTTDPDQLTPSTSHFADSLPTERAGQLEGPAGRVHPCSRRASD